MPKKIMLFVLALVLLSLPCYAQQQQRQQPEESISITTYYPSPYGAYNELQTNKMAIGDTNKDGKLSSADQPANNGELLVAGNVGIGGDVAINGKPSWSGKKFEGWYELTDTAPETSCKIPSCRGWCSGTCKETCESFACTCQGIQKETCTGSCDGHGTEGCNMNVCGIIGGDCSPYGSYESCQDSTSFLHWKCVCRCPPTSPKKILVPTFK